METAHANPEGFKTCPLCGESWATLDEFVRDRTLRVDGYTAVFDDPGTGLVFLTHRRPGCMTTLTVYAHKLRPLYHGPTYMVRLTGTDACRRLCVDRSKLDECPAPCSMAWVRSVMQCLRRHKLPGAH